MSESVGDSPRFQVIVILVPSRNRRHLEKTRVSYYHVNSAERRYIPLYDGPIIVRDEKRILVNEVSSKWVYVRSHGEEEVYEAGFPKTASNRKPWLSGYNKQLEGSKDCWTS
jgi:hypothetical protein